MRDLRNEGIYQTGGSISVGGSLAVGKRAQAISVVGTARQSLEAKGLDEVSAKLGELLEALSAHADQLDDPDPVYASVQDVAEELAKTKPDRSRIRAIVAAISESAKSVTGLATAAAELGRVVSLLG